MAARKGRKGRYWCRKHEDRVEKIKAFKVCLLKRCPHLEVRAVRA